MVHLLTAWKLQVGRNELNLVFADAKGEPLRRTTIIKANFWPALTRAGLRHVRFHSLRHSFATRLIQHGAPVTEVAQQLGHANPGITLKVYSHWFRSADSGAAAAYSDALFAGVDTK
jgi:integrase